MASELNGSASTEDDGVWMGIGFEGKKVKDGLIVGWLQVKGNNQMGWTSLYLFDKLLQSCTVYCFLIINVELGWRDGLIL